MTLFWQLQAPSAILAVLGPFQIRWYGLIITAAIFSALWLGRKLLSRYLSDTVLYDLFFYVVLGGIVGARLFHVFIFEWSYYRDHLLDIIKIWHGGIAIQGAIAGGVVTLYIFCRIKKLSFWQILDNSVPALVLGQAIGRWGNYFNQELFGHPATGPLAIYIDPNHRPAGYQEFATFQPTFLYESILSLLLLALLWKYRSKFSLGQTTAVYLMGYGVIRFIMDFIRIDTEIMWLGLKLSQYFSLIFIVVGLLMFWQSRKSFFVSK